METECFQLYKLLVSEITDGMEQLKELKASSSSKQDALLERMMSSYEEALSILNGTNPEGQCQSAMSSLSAPSGSSASECRVTQSKDSTRGSYKRKSLSRFTEKVTVQALTSGEPDDDGYSWRKYGQKDILGSKYPRSYYKCTSRGTRGCVARKQIQRSVDDPSTFEVTYHGKHTCSTIKPIAPRLTSLEYLD